MIVKAGAGEKQGGEDPGSCG